MPSRILTLLIALVSVIFVAVPGVFSEVEKLNIDWGPNTEFLPYNVIERYHFSYATDKKTIDHSLLVLNAVTSNPDSMLLVRPYNPNVNVDGPAIISLLNFNGMRLIDDNPVRGTLTDVWVLDEGAGLRRVIVAGGYRNDSAFVFKSIPGQDKVEAYFLTTGVDHSGNGRWEPKIVYVANNDYDYDGRTEVFFYVYPVRDLFPRTLFCIEVPAMSVEWALPVASVLETGCLFVCGDSSAPAVMFTSSNPKHGVSDGNFSDLFAYLTIVNNRGEIVYNRIMSTDYHGIDLIAGGSDSVFYVSHSLPFLNVADSASLSDPAWSVSAIDKSGGVIRTVAVESPITKMGLFDYRSDGVKDFMVLTTTGRLFLYTTDLELTARSEKTNLTDFRGVVRFPGHGEDWLIFTTRDIKTVLYSSELDRLAAVKVGGAYATPLDYGQPPGNLMLLMGGKNDGCVVELKKKDIYDYVGVIVWGHYHELLIILVVALVGLIIVNQFRARSSRALRESEKKYRTLLDNLPVGVFRSTPEGRMISLNPAIVSLYGYESAEEMLKQPAESGYADPKQRDEFIKQLKVEGEVNNLEIQIRRKDGSIKWVSASARAVKDDTGKMIYFDGIDIDITDRKIAEEALRRSEEKARAQYLSIPMPTYTWQKSGNDFVLVDYNDKAVEVTAGNIRNIMGGRLSLMHTRWPESLSDIWRCFNEKTVIRREMPYTFATTGKQVYLSVNYAFVPPDLVMVHTDDITERKKAEQALRESEKKFRALAETTAAAIFIYREDNLVYSNPMAEALTGYSYDELNTMNFWDIIHPDVRELIKQRGRERLRGQEVPISYEVPILTKLGETRWVLYAGGTVEFGGERVVLGTAFDITAKKQAEAELQLANEERYGQVKQIAGGLAHEIYNALFPATSSLNLLKSRINLATIEEVNRNRKLINLAEEAVIRAIHMTELVTRFSRLESEQEIETIPLKPFIQELLSGKGPATQEGVTVNVDVDDNAAITMNRLHAFSLLNNIINNALDAVADTERRELSITARMEGNKSRIEIMDTGCGIDPTILPKIFSPFFSTKPRTGTGLGLAICKRVVDIYGGKLIVESNLDKGTKFTIFV